MLSVLPHLVLLGAILAGINCLIFLKELIMKTPFQSHHIHITFSDWRLAFGVIGSASFHLPYDLFFPMLLYSICFSLPVKICFKNGKFSLCLSRELHAETELRKIFSLMWNPNIKEINITRLVLMIFKAWFGYFKYVGYLLCGITLIALN